MERRQVKTLSPLAHPVTTTELFLYSFHLLELNMEGSSRHLQCEYEAEICRMMLRLMCVIAFLPTMTAAAEYPSEVGQLIDLMVPGLLIGVQF
jgi:hypothetical protein